MRTVCALLALLPTVFAVDCRVEPDGVYEKGCRAFVTCKNNVAHVTECQYNYVFNENTGQCADPKSFSSLCSESRNCSVLTDGKYADWADKCKTYYTCIGGVFFGHNYCPGAQTAYGVNCTALTDGVYERSCRSFTVCHAGKPEVKFCTNGLVFNSKTGSCDSPTVVDPPCGVSRNCTGKADGVYVDDGCHSYYTCLGEVFFGHDLCPKGLVFNMDLKICDWPNQVAAPCGTKH